MRNIMRCFMILFFPNEEYTLTSTDKYHNKAKQHRVCVISTQLFSSPFSFSMPLEPIYYYHKNNVENKHPVQQKYQNKYVHNQAQQPKRVQGTGQIHTQKSKNKKRKKQ